ncbi:MAG: hypothetical protein QW350_05725 [Candidatus Aenigmatarchaeota archaeon]
MAQNLYSNFPTDVLDSILLDRELKFKGTREEKIEFLLKADNEDPEWLQSIVNTTVLKDLNLTEMYVYASALYGISYDEIKDLSEGSLEEYLNIMDLILLDFDDEEYIFEELFEKLRNASEKILELVSKKVQVPVMHLKFLGAVDDYSLIESLKPGYDKTPLLKSKDIERCIDRYNKIEPYRDIMFDMYHRRAATNSELIEIAMIKPHPLEDLVINFRSHIKRVLKIFEVVVPPMYKNNPQDYFAENIREYVRAYFDEDDEDITVKDLMESNDKFRKLESLSDVKIFSLFNLSVFYRSRKELINNFVNAIDNKTFLLSFNPKTQTVDNSKVCYGTLTKFQTYEIEKILNSFKSGSFKIPDSDEIFNEDNVITLKNILENSENPSSSKVIKIIKQIFKNKYNLKEHSEKALKTFEKVRPCKTREILFKIYRIGKALKEWKFITHPLEEIEVTFSRNFERLHNEFSFKVKQIKTLKEFKEVKEQLSERKEKELFVNLISLEYLEDLEMYRYFNQSFYDLFNKITKDKDIQTLKSLGKKVESSAKFYLELFKYL